MDDLTVVQKEVAKVIENSLYEAKKRCAYKMAHEPKGWTSVNMKQCSVNLTKRICDKFSFIKK